MKSGITYNIEGSSQRIEIIVPTLAQVHATGHSEVELMKLELEESLRIEVTDFSELMGTIEADEVQAFVTEHSLLALNGSVYNVTGEVSNHSTVDLTQLDAAMIDFEVDQFSTVEQ
jgi:hypothetical protein